MTDFVLVHGAWGGGWGYDRLRDDLVAAGHRVLVAELSGLGARAAALHPGISLTTHIEDVLEQIAVAGFDRFVLAGHSYGGMVVTGVAARIGARIDRLVYIDAFLPVDGQSLWDLTGDFEHNHYIDSQKFTPGAVAPLPGLEMPLLTRHPLLTFLEAVRIDDPTQAVANRTYIFASAWPHTPFTRFRDAVCNDPAWRYHELACSHDVMGDCPEQLLAIMLAPFDRQ